GDNLFRSSIPILAQTGAEKTKRLDRAAAPRTVDVFMRVAATFFPSNLLSAVVMALGLAGCSATPPPAPPATPPPISLPMAGLPKPPPREERVTPVMLGIDVLEAEGFAAVKGKRI